ncbi:MAG TPA: four helix bundle protein [Thermoanaerobaculia bacterium]
MHNDNSDVYERSFQFACRVLKMDQALSKNRRVNRNAMNQLINAATSVGSNLEEAKGAHSRADFHAKIRISLKEARESHYWLRLLSSSGIVSQSRLAPLIQEASEIVAILTVIAKKTNPKNSQPLTS